MNFEITEKELQLINNWKKNLPHIEADVFGKEYLFEYTFIPTGLGLTKKIRRVDGVEFDFTDYSDW
ncbi:MAG: hypothetical protein ACJAYP_000785 [Flavobacterium sp.]|jgi:hypothetical protein